MAKHICSEQLFKAEHYRSSVKEGVSVWSKTLQEYIKSSRCYKPCPSAKNNKQPASVLRTHTKFTLSFHVTTSRLWMTRSGVDPPVFLSTVGCSYSLLCDWSWEQSLWMHFHLLLHIPQVILHSAQICLYFIQYFFTFILYIFFLLFKDFFCIQAMLSTKTPKQVPYMLKNCLNLSLI